MLQQFPVPPGSHVDEACPRLCVTPAHGFFVDIRQQTMGFAMGYPLGPRRSMLRTSVRCRVPVAVRSVIEAAVAARPVRKVREGLVEEAKIVRKQFRFQLPNRNLQTLGHESFRPFSRPIRRTWSVDSIHRRYFLGCSFSIYTKIASAGYSHKTYAKS